MVKRRANGEGSLTYRKSRARWEGRCLVLDENGVKHYKTVSAKTKAEASDKLRKLVMESKERKYSFEKCDTLKNYAEHWRNLMTRRYEMHPDDPDNYKPRTIEEYMRNLKRVFLPVLGSKPINKISKKDVRLALQNFNDATGHTRTCQIGRSALSAMMKLAISEEKLSENPAIGIPVPKYKRAEKEIWTDEELQRFINVAKNSKLYPLYLLLVCCGLRRGEALGLRKCDCDLDKTVIHVRQQVVAVNNKPTITTLKTEASYRDISIDKDASAILRKWIEEDTSTCELMFHTKNGMPIAPRNFARSYKKLVQKAGIKYLSPHSLRHRFCTDMCMSGVDQKTNQALMGHSDPSVILKVYAHATESSMVNAIEKLNGRRKLNLIVDY